MRGCATSKNVLLLLTIEMILNAIQNDGKIREIQEDVDLDFFNLGDFKWLNTDSNWYAHEDQKG